MRFAASVRLPWFCTVPTIRLIPKAGGEDTAANVPGARLRIVPGMGHFLPEALVPLLVDEIAGHCLEAENAARSKSR